MLSLELKKREAGGLDGAPFEEGSQELADLESKIF
jgi:hypothetical protein